MVSRSTFLSGAVWVLSVLSVIAQNPESGAAPKFKRISGDKAIKRALKTASLTYHGQPFHALLTISQPEAKDSLFQGTVEIYWANATKYRVVVASADFHQTRIVNGSQVEEQNLGDFYPAWLRNYVQALMDPLPREKDFRGRRGSVAVGDQQTKSCLNRDDRPNGITDPMTWASICFGGKEPRIESAVDFTYFMEFGEYQRFGKKQIARSYTIYTDGNDKVVGQLAKLEELKSADEKLFLIEHPTPPEQQIKTSFVPTATNESLLEKVPVMDWPPVRQGKAEGYMIVHVVTDREGQVKEAYKHNSDNPGLEEYGREQALKYKFKPLVVNGAAQQMETPLVLHFTSRIGDSFPVVTGEDIEKYAAGCRYDPVLPEGLLPSGTSFKIRVSVDEEGKDTGEVFPKEIPWKVIQEMDFDTTNCRFKPFLVNSQPSNYHIDFLFTAP